MPASLLAIGLVIFTMIAGTLNITILMDRRVPSWSPMPMPRLRRLMTVQLFVISSWIAACALDATHTGLQLWIGKAIVLLGLIAVLVLIDSEMTMHKNTAIERFDLHRTHHDHAR